MSYTIGLYDKRFLRRALEQDLGDWTNPDPIGQETLNVVRDRLAAKGYLLEIDGPACQQFSHPKRAIQVFISEGEVEFSIPYWDDAESAVQVALADAKELATAAGLGLYDPQEGETT